MSQDSVWPQAGHVLTGTLSQVQGEAKLQRGSAFSSQQGDWVLDRSGERG